MKHKNTMLLLFAAVLTAAFLAGCAEWQTGGGNSGYSDHSGGHGGHH